jgi:hypothetical protein
MIPALGFSSNHKGCDCLYSSNNSRFALRANSLTAHRKKIQQPFLANLEPTASISSFAFGSPKQPGSGDEATQPLAEFQFSLEKETKYDMPK